MAPVFGKNGREARLELDRREFMRWSAAGAGGVGAASGGSSATSDARNQGVRRFFPANLPGGEAVPFRAAGYSAPACGVIYRRENRVPHGMPLGGVGTGFLDIETNGTFGFASIFNSGVPLVGGPWRAPFLGINVEGRTWTLTLEETVGLGNASEIEYWGHYPVLDMEYETTAPVSVGVRAWSPFIPGDVKASDIPAAIFEVHLRNTSTAPKTGTLAFHFPGPSQAEAQIAPDSPRESKRISWWPMSLPVTRGVVPANRGEVDAGELQGLSVSSGKGTGYVLGVLASREKPRFGGSLWTDGYDFANQECWSRVHKQLPKPAATEFSSSMAVDFHLEPGETRIVRILLAWYSPIWKGEGDHHFARMYTTRYKDAVEVAHAVARDHASLLDRILAWQQAVYTADENPVWLREALVNILHLIPRTSYWAAARPPIGDWCRPEDGLFGMNECPRECPQIECIGCSFYGNIPLVYFFPELALSTLRGYQAYQYPDGAAPWIFGGCTGGMAQGYRATDGADMASPSPGYQTTLNGASYVSMVDRLWQRTANDEILKEFYLSVKQNTIYTMNLRKGPDGVASVPEGNRNPTQPKARPGAGLDWFEGNDFFGMTPHVAGIHMAQLRIARRMAEKMGDREFSAQCDEWLRQGSASVENRLWTGKYYLNYYEPESGKKSDLIFGYQLDGDWMCFFHGLPGVFRPDRAKIALETIKSTCMALTPYGAAHFANPDGTAAASEKFMATTWGLDYGSYGFFVPEAFMLAALYMYQGQREVGMGLAKSCVHGIVKWGCTWTQPNIVNGATGRRVFGSDYYQNLMLWAVPGAIQKADLRGASGPGSLVDRVIQAGKDG